MQPNSAIRPQDKEGVEPSTEAEQALLGALILNGQAFDRVAGLVTAADFQSEDHAAIFRAVGEIRGEGATVDLVTLAEQLRRTSPEALANAGGAGYLAGLVQNTPSALHVHRYAELVHEKALCRRVHGVALDLAQAARGYGARSPVTLIAEARARLAKLADALPAGHQLRAISSHDLLNLALPELEPLLSPWLFQKNLCMVHARRGVGKTHFALGVAFAVATAGRLADWTAPKRRGVLYVDGEMPVQLMQARLRELTSGAGEVPEFLRVVTPDAQDKPMPDLATAAGQAEIDALVREDTALIVVDNLSCLVRSGGAENESESWTAVADWALKHRRGGRAIMFIHHSGKSGAQRGTSKREDLLDTVIGLRRPGDYQEADGAVFEAHFEKARSLTGGDISPIEFRLQQLDGGGHAWSHASAATKMQDRIRALWDSGTLTLTDVVKEVGCNKSHAHRTLEAAMDRGELVRPYPAKSRGSKVLL